MLLEVQQRVHQAKRRVLPCKLYQGRKNKSKEEGGKQMSKMSIDEAFGIVCKRLDDYDTFLLMVSTMRKAQKEANDLIAQVECYEEAMEHIKKAEELEQMVDKWLEGEAL